MDDAKRRWMLPRITLGGLPEVAQATEEEWQKHFGAGELYNEIAANANMASYFQRALLRLGLVSDSASDDELYIPYIVPGAEPDDAQEREVLEFLKSAARQRDWDAAASWAAILGSLAHFYDQDESDATRRQSQEGARERRQRAGEDAIVAGYGS